MARTKGIASFSANFEPTGQSIFDARLTVPTRDDLYTAYESNNYYEKMVVMVENESMLYILKDSSKRTEADGWEPLFPTDDTDTYYVRTQNGWQMMNKAMIDTLPSDSGVYAWDGAKWTAFNPAIQWATFE